MPVVRDRYTDAEVREYYEQGCWTGETFGDILRRQADAWSGKTFVTDGETSRTYRELWADSIRVAVGLRERGVAAGDRVLVQLPNWTEFVVVAAAIARLGAVMVPVMPIYRRDEVGHVLDDAQVTAVVTPSVFREFDYLGMYEDLAKTRPDLHTIVVVRADDAAGDGPITSLAAVTADVDPAAADTELGSPAGPDDPFVIVYTSGTTARPKGCVHTFNTYSSGSRSLQVAFGYTSDDVQFGPSPVTHTTGLVTSVLLPLIAGAATHLMAAWEPGRGLEEIARYGCTGCVTATTFLQMLMDAYDPERHDASTLRVWVLAGSPIPSAVVERANRLLPQLKILSLYGRSENLATTTCTVEDGPERALTSDGSAMPFAEVQVVDVDGEPVPAGAEGDIAYQGPSHMLGYLGRPQETAELYTQHGFSRSGDLGVADGDGYVRVTGRTKDIVIRGGMNISVREIEDILAGHPAIRGAAVVGMPDERLGERVCCYVVPANPDEPVTLASLRAYLEERGTAVQKSPERLEIVDALPMTATGKVQKHLLRADVTRKLQAPSDP